MKISALTGIAKSVTYSGAMTTPPDPHDLARRFLDLWQDQVQAMATDPEMADSVRRWTALWAGAMHPGSVAPSSRGGTGDGLQPGYRPAAGAAYDAASTAESASPSTAESASHGSGGALGDGPDNQERDEHGWSGKQRIGERRPTAAGSAAAAAVPDHGSDDVALILRELRRLEARIARLETRLEGGGEQPARPTRGPRGGAGRSRG